MLRGALSTSHRRRMLDRGLSRLCTTLRGTVLDVGGERERRRGAFSPDHWPELRWVCLNIDPSVRPDVLADASCLPILSEQVDAVVCTEVLEHLAHPDLALMEMTRCLRPGGSIVVTVPFLFPVHADPCDYYRYTSWCLQEMLMRAGLEGVAIHTQGGYFAVLTDMMRDAVERVRPTPVRWLLGAPVLLLRPILLWLDAVLADRALVQRYPEGYLATARKPG